VDEVTRSAWVQGTANGSEWHVVGADAEAPKWTSVAMHEAGAATCAAEGAGALSEVLATDASYLVAPWHGAPVVEVVGVGACDDRRPVELSVDGERLVASPSDRVVRWHVRVRGDAARVRRADHSRARVFALLAQSKACAPHIEAIQAPRVAASLPVLRFDGDAVAPGLELWLSEGAAL